MKFENVLPDLRQGKRIRRASWKEYNYYWRLDKIDDKVYNQSGEVIATNTHTKEAFKVFTEGQDWEVVTEKSVGHILYEAYWEAHQQYSKLMDNDYRYLAPIPYHDLDVHYGQVWEKAAKAVIDTKESTQ